MIEEKDLPNPQDIDLEELKLRQEELELQIDEETLNFKKTKRKLLASKK